jgi:hypothetical protein
MLFQRSFAYAPEAKLNPHKNFHIEAAQWRRSYVIDSNGHRPESFEKQLEADL